MYGCKSWTIKKAERQRIDAFELWCWRRLLRVPWTARRSNQSILKEISPDCSLEGLMLKLKLQYFGHLMQRVDSLEKPWCWERLRAGGEGDDGGWDGWMASPTQWTWVWVNLGVGDGQGGLVCCSQWGRRVGHDWVTELNWTELPFPKWKELRTKAYKFGSWTWGQGLCRGQAAQGDGPPSTTMRPISGEKQREGQVKFKMRSLSLTHGLVGWVFLGAWTPVFEPQLLFTSHVTLGKQTKW